MWKKIYYGFYEINRKGDVRRAKKGKATYPGRMLIKTKVWNTDVYGYQLSRDCQVKFFTVDQLLKRAFG